MIESANIALGLFIGSTILLYLIGIIEMIISANKYKYNKLWIIASLPFLVCPPFFMIFISLLEKSSIKKENKYTSVDLLNAKIKTNIAIAFFVFYYSLYPLFVMFFRLASVNDEWYKEIALVCINIVLLTLYFVFLYSRKMKNSMMSKNRL